MDSIKQRRTSSSEGRLDGEAANMRASTLSVVPCAEFRVGQLVIKLDSERSGGDSLAVIHGMSRCNKEVHVINTILPINNMSADKLLAGT